MNLRVFYGNPNHKIVQQHTDPPSLGKTKNKIYYSISMTKNMCTFKYIDF